MSGAAAREPQQAAQQRRGARAARRVGEFAIGAVPRLLVADEVGREAGIRHAHHYRTRVRFLAEGVRRRAAGFPAWRIADTCVSCDMLMSACDAIEQASMPSTVSKETS